MYAISSTRVYVGKVAVNKGLTASGECIKPIRETERATGKMIDLTTLGKCYDQFLGEDYSTQSKSCSID
jgi:hypothetical protein